MLVELYPAREQPIEGISEQTIAGLMKNPRHIVLSKSMLAEWMRQGDFDVLLNVGAGDVSDMLPPLVEELKRHPRR